MRKLLSVRVLYIREKRESVCGSSYFMEDVVLREGVKVRVIMLSCHVIGFRPYTTVPGRYACV
jgi:hypothetical protein